MGLIEWSDKFSVGVDDIDFEHRQLINLINELYQKLDGDHSKDEIAELFGELYADISAHFALEEKMMRESRYAEYRAHKDEHENLLDDIRDLMDDYSDKPEFDRDELTRRLGEWFGGHFKEMDARLHRHFR